jgi:hypothetical protein
LIRSDGGAPFCSRLARRFSDTNKFSTLTTFRNGTKEKTMLAAAVFQQGLEAFRDHCVIVRE